MALFKRKQEPTPETLEFLADAADLTARQIRRDTGRSTEQENDAEAAVDQAAEFRGRAAKARKQGS
jgi:hypothetical protein